MRRLAVVALVALALGSVALAVPSVAQESYISIDDVTVSPSQPAADESVTFTVEIRNLQGSSPFRITDVALRKAGDSREHARVENLGTISPGQTFPVPVTTSFSKNGTRNLRVHVWGQNQDSGNSQHVTYPVSVTVQGQHPGLTVDTPDTVDGVDHRGNVTVANGFDEPIRNVRVRVTGADGVTVSESRTVLARLESGQTARTNFTYRANGSGSGTLTTHLEYTTAAGTVRSIARNATVDAEPLREAVVLETEMVGSGDDRALRVDVLNQGNAPLNDVTLAATAPNASLRRAFLDGVPPGERRSGRMNVSELSGSTQAALNVSYEVGQQRRYTAKNVTVSAAPGAIELTGVDVTREAGKYLVSGSTSNVGLSPVDSVQVSVVSTEAVDPVAPSREYFVGSVPASDVFSFELTAQVTGNASSIPVEITYLIDGERKKRVERVQLPSAPVAGGGAQGQGDGGSSPLPLVVGGTATLLVVALFGRYYFGLGLGSVTGGGDGDGADGEP